MIRSTRLQLAAPVEELLEAARLAILRRRLEAHLRAGLEALDMPTQCRGRRDAQDVIETVSSTPVENFGTAIMAVGTQQDLGVRPVGADRPQQAAQEGADLFATRPFGGAKHSCDEAPLAVEHDDRLKAIIVVIRIEEPQLLAAMSRIKRVVDVERDPFRDLPERLAIKIDHGASHAQKGAGIRQVLKPRDGRLRTQFAVRGSKVMRHLEYRIDAKTVGVVAVLVAGGDHQEAEADDVGESVRNLIGRTRILDTASETISDAQPLLDLSQHQDAAVRRQQTTIEFLQRRIFRRQLTGRATAA
jgi:hypothetical protein